ncbi:MAG: C40 family peptidase [Oscillospiraceae bacterium]|nr:C40 family peptidase [Oscillospiraceae bacterium]
MREKEPRIRFTRSDVEQIDPAVRLRARPLARERYAGRGKKAEEQASGKLHPKQRSAQAQAAKLSFQRAGTGLGTAVSSRVRERAAEYENDNAGAEALDRAGETAETGAGRVASGHFSRKLRRYDKGEKLEDSGGRADDPYSGDRSAQKAKETTSTNPQSRRQQRQAIKREYAEVRSGTTTGTAGGNTTAVPRPSVVEKLTKGATKAGAKAKDAGEKAVSAAKSHPLAFLIGGVLGVIVLVTVSTLSSCSALVSDGGTVILASTYTAEDEEILATEAAYCDLEEGLRERIRRVESDNPGYDAYEVHASEISHNPYELAALLTVLYEDYTLEEVREALGKIFEAQYGYSVSHRTEEDEEDPHGTREILTVEVVNRGLGSAAASFGLTDDEMARYRLLAARMGNRDYLFADNIYANPAVVIHYDIPGEALSDVRFARMIQEGEKYLGYPYVWGGSSPSTSFDCSGFVSWVINHSGNGWNVGRPSAEGLRNLCAIIPESEAKPGDLVFFQGTYETSCASHVGIYVGDGMMLHCGNPIQYASIETSYWQQHFLCFGRLPA